MYVNPKTPLMLAFMLSHPRSFAFGCCFDELLSQPEKNTPSY